MTDESFKTKKTTLAELGPNLPIGLRSPSGSYETRLSARRWTLKEEKQLARFKAEESTYTKYVSTVLGTMLSRIGPANFDEVTDIYARKVAVGQMYMADVFYAYVWLRIQAIGPELVVPVKCRKCNTEFNFTGDLNTTEVIIPADKEKVEWEFFLRDPIQVRSKTVSGFRIGQQIWARVESTDASDGDKASIIMNSVRGFVGDLDPNGKPYDLDISSNELDELSKYDLEKLSRELNNKFLGANMTLDVTCVSEKCANMWVVPLNWMYDSFFAVSSA